MQLKFKFDSSNNFCLGELIRVPHSIFSLKVIIIIIILNVFIFSLILMSMDLFLVINPVRSGLDICQETTDVYIVWIVQLSLKQTNKQK